MNRIDLINEIIKKKKNNLNYLEIGVNHGVCFYKINCKNKTGVDPSFDIRLTDKIQHKIPNIHNLFSNNKLVELTSDDFFLQKKKENDNTKYDVIFIDGLHTYEQTYIDVLNSLNYLEDDGVIIMHDCNPPFDYSAYPAKSYEEYLEIKRPEWGPEWTGDVWKTIVRLKSERKDINVFVFDFDYGLGIVTKGKPEKDNYTFSKDEVDQMTYVNLKDKKIEMLDLKSENEVNLFLSKLR